MGVLAYVGKRLALYFAVLFIGLTITFMLPRLMPINPVDGYIGQIQARANGVLTVEAIAELRTNLETLYGLNGDIFSQYVNYLQRIVLRFDFGPSFAYYPQPVSAMLLAALPWTLGLLLVSTVIAWIMGNMVGLVAGYFHKKKAASLLEFVGILLYPIPYYILAVTALLLLAYVFPIFPLSATFPVGQMTPEKFGMIIYNSLLPGITLVLAGFGWNILSMKALTVATTEEPYVTYARLKGASNWTRMISYVFRNALLPQVTALALSLGMVFNGALLTEMIFSYPGIGLQLVDAVRNHDVPVVQALSMIIAGVYVVVNLIADLLSILLTPRARTAISS